MDFLSRAEELFSYTQFMRRDFHMHPELGFQEIRIAGIVAKELQALGLEITRGIGKTGVVALLEGGKPGPVLLLRADMDALPINEQTGAEYASQNDGVMHACGHDGHIAILLTVVKMLHAVRTELPGTIKFVFQPAEEGIGGAESMINEGVLDNPKVDMVMGLHLWNEKPLGWLGIAEGPIMAGAEEFKVKIIGKGGHGAIPHMSVDPILAGAQVVSALQSIVARNVPPLKSAVVSVTTFHGGEAFNVIPAEIHMTGTIRTFDMAVRDIVIKRFNEVVKGISESMGCSAEIEMSRLTPAVINDRSFTILAQEAARKVLPGITLDTSYITMVSEDFSYFTQKKPGIFFLVGSANTERGLDFSHHHPKFDFEETVLPHATALMAQAVVELLNDKKE